MKRTITVAALTLGLLGATAGTALADGSGYVGGHALRGEVVATSTHPGEDCISRRALLVSNFVRDDSVERYDGRSGTGWACVTREAFDRYPVGSFWPGYSTQPRG